MKNILFYSGNIEWQGDMQKLLHIITGVDGVLKDEGEFFCTFQFPRRRGNGIQASFLHMTNKMHFHFRCRYERNAGGFRITFRMMPGMSAWLVFVVPLLVPISEIELWSEKALIFLITAVICWGMYAVARHSCITQFVEWFK